MRKHTRSGHNHLTAATASKPRRGNARVKTVAMIVILTGLAPLSVARAASWQPVGKMVQHRAFPRVTLLLDGSVLVTGGILQEGRVGAPLAKAERFDPKTNSFTAVGDMAYIRDDSHAPVRLQDGRVLVVGGWVYQSQLADAELFDPATGRFALTGKMLQDRSGPTATLLPNGQVLVAGGWGSKPFEHKASAELFDPVAGGFRMTGRLTVGRSRHNAVALADGRVVILGGYGKRDRTLTSVEIYDPATGTFAAGGDLAQSRGDASAVLLPDGRILVAGGLHTAATGRPVPENSIEIYDPATGKSSITDTLPAGGVGICISLRDGHVLVAGGQRTADFKQEEDVLKDAWLVDPTTGKLSPTLPMNIRRVGFGGALLPDGRVLVLAGWVGQYEDTDTAEVYVP